MQGEGEFLSLNENELNQNPIIRVNLLSFDIGRKYVRGRDHSLMKNIRIITKLKAE